MNILLRFTGGGQRYKGLDFKNFVFFKIFSKFEPIKTLISPQKAFSIAEAMITLLIVSIALAVTAPIMSKKSLSDIGGQIPPGAIMAFDRNSCPPSWTPITDIFENSEGAFIRNIRGNAANMGRVQEDAAPNITGTGPRFASEIWNGAGLSGAIVWSSANTASKGENGDGGWSGWNGWILDASRSSPVYGRDGATEVRPKNIAFLYCRKD